MERGRSDWSNGEATNKYENMYTLYLCHYQNHCRDSYYSHESTLNPFRHGEASSTPTSALHPPPSRTVSQSPLPIPPFSSPNLHLLPHLGPPEPEPPSDTPNTPNTPNNSNTPHTPHSRIYVIPRARESGRSLPRSESRVGRAVALCGAA